MVEQGGDGGDLGAVAEGGECIGHVLPVVGGILEVGALAAGLRAGVLVAAHSGGGPVPILHHLSHGGGDAAGDCFFTGPREVGTEVVVVGGLPPGGGHEGSDGGAVDGLGRRACQEQRPLRVGRQRFVGGNSLYVCVVAIEPMAHVFGYRGVGILEGSVQGVAQDGQHTVVGSGNGEATAVDGEEVESGPGGVERGQSALVDMEEDGDGAPCIVRGDGLGGGDRGEEGASHQGEGEEEDASFHKS